MEPQRLPIGPKLNPTIFTFCNTRVNEFVLTDTLFFTADPARRCHGRRKTKAGSIFEERLSSFTRGIWRGRKRIRQRGMIRDRSAVGSFRPSWPRILRGDIKTIYIWHNLSRPRPDQRRSDSQRVTVIYHGTLRRHNGNKWLEGRSLTSYKSCNESDPAYRSIIAICLIEDIHLFFRNIFRMLNFFKNLLSPLSNFNSLSCKLYIYNSQNSKRRNSLYSIKFEEIILLIKL